MKWSQVKKILDNMTEEQLDDPALTFDNDEAKYVQFVGWFNDHGHLALQQDVCWFKRSPEDPHGE
jgi:hypothetical protein